MKKTLRVNISGTIFNIDEDAYYELKKYLDVIELRYSGSTEGMEIFSDIEARIAEHLSEKINASKTVINQDDISEVIDIMGRPEDFDADDAGNDPITDKTSKSKNRRMYRDPNGKYIAGVASGVSKYFGINPLIIRGFFVVSLFFAGTGLLIYLILWIALPEAITPSQKLEMNGEAITVSNIENSLNEEFKNVKENFDKFKNSDRYDDLKEKTNRVVSGIGFVLLTFFKIVLILIGIVLVLSALSAIFGITGGLFFSDTIVSVTSEGTHSFDHWVLIDLIDNSSARYFVYIGFILTAILPLIIILFFGLKLIFRFKSNNKVIILSALGLWIAGLITLSFAAASLSSNFKQTAEVIEKHEIDFPKGKILKIDLRDKDLSKVEDVLIDFEELIVYKSDSNKIIMLEPKLSIVPTVSDKISLRIIKTARGKTKKQAYENAGDVSVFWKLEDSVLHLNRFYEFLGQNNWRNQEVEIVLKVPSNERIFIDKSLKELHLHAKNTEYFWDYEIVGRELMMTDEGVCIPNSAESNNNNFEEPSENNTEATDEKLNELEEELN